VSNIDFIEINNSNCTATTVHDGAGIGSGYALSGEATVRTIHIINATITASGYSGAAIGSGHGSFGDARMGELWLTGSIVRAYAQNSPGIGSGYSPDGKASLNHLVIRDCDVESVSAWNGPGIGSGIGSAVDTLEICDSKVYAEALVDGAGIGTSVAVRTGSTVRSILIERSRVAATGALGAGIGAAIADDGVSGVDQLLLKSSRLTVVGNIGIGAPTGGAVGNLALSGEMDLTCFSDSNSCFGGTPILTETSRLHATTDTEIYVDPVWANRSDFEALRLFGEYRVASQGENFGSQPMLHFGKINGLAKVSYTLTLRKVGGGEAPGTSFQIDGATAVGLIASTGSVGTFAVDIVKTGESQLGQICADNDEVGFEVGHGETFVTSVKVCGMGLMETDVLPWTWIALGASCFLLLIIGVVAYAITRRSPDTAERTRIA
jgi:hypothetical protein